MAPVRSPLDPPNVGALRTPHGGSPGEQVWHQRPLLAVPPAGRPAAVVRGRHGAGPRRKPVRGARAAFGPPVSRRVVPPRRYLLGDQAGPDLRGVAPAAAADTPLPAGGGLREGA